MRRASWDLRDKQRENCLKMIDNSVLQVLMAQTSTQLQIKMANQLNPVQAATFMPLNALEEAHKAMKWLPHDLPNRQL